MESLKNIRNDALVQAYHTMHENKSLENQNAVTRQMVGATFLVPVIPIPGKLPEDFPPKLLKNEQGQLFLPLFTDMQQVQPGGPAFSESMIPVDISDAYGYLVDNEKLMGAIVNAFDKPNLTCGRPLVQSIAKLWSRVKTAEMNGEDPEEVFHPKKQDVKLMVPKTYPDGVVFALNAGMKEIPMVSRSWMCVVQKNPTDRPEDCDWMIILETDDSLKGHEGTFQTLGKSLSPLLGKHNVIFTETNPNLKALTDQVTPIYVRKEEDA